MKATITEIVITLFLISISLGLRSSIAQASPTTTFYVDPASIVDPSLTPGSSFTINVNVADAEGLYAWQVYMSWNTALLDATDIVFGDFLADQPEGTEQLSRIVNEEGWLLIGEVTIGPNPGVYGSGWLCSITFLVETSGETVLDINSEYTYYIDSLGVVIGDDPGELIKENGYFDNRGGTIPATVDIYPDPLILGRKGGSVTAYIELPEGYDLNNIDVSTIRLNLEVPARLHPTRIGDYDEDGIPDLMVKFDKKEVIPLLIEGENTLTVTGEVSGEMFEGSDTITAI